VILEPREGPRIFRGLSPPGPSFSMEASVFSQLAQARAWRVSIIRSPEKSRR
jgi:hypothetical protein